MPQSRRPLPTDILPVTKLVKALLLGLAVMTLPVENEEETRPLATDAVSRLTRSAVRRGSTPVVQSPGVFSAEEDLADLQLLRQQHGQEYGRARFTAQKIPTIA